MADQTFDSFIAQVRALLEPTASGKGYSTTGVDGQNQLYEFVASFTGPHHALGEIVYKAKRYEAKRNLEDVLKIAAWAFLVYKHHADAAVQAGETTTKTTTAATAREIVKQAQALSNGLDGVKFVPVGEHGQWIKA